MFNSFALGFESVGCRLSRSPKLYVNILDRWNVGSSEMQEHVFGSIWDSSDGWI